MKIQHLVYSLVLGLTLTACGKSAPEPAPTTAPAAAPATGEPAAPAETAGPATDEAPPSAPSAAPAEAPSKDAAGPLKAGSPAPDVTLKLTDGSEVALSSLKGQRVLIYFYPKDDTPGCTAQAKGIRDAWPDLEAAGIAVYGVSMQGADSHEAFIAKYDLPFPLAIDDGTLAEAFDVPLRFGLTARQSFLVGEDGTLEHVWREVDAGNHAADVLAAVK